MSWVIVRSEPSRSQTPSASDVAAIVKELQAEEEKLEDDHSKVGVTPQTKAGSRGITPFP